MEWALTAVPGSSGSALQASVTANVTGVGSLTACVTISVNHPADVHQGESSYGGAKPSFYNFNIPKWGPDWGDVRIAAFIAGPRIEGVGLGDNRGFSADGNPPPDRSRLFLDLDFADGRGSFRANPSCLVQITVGGVGGVPRTVGGCNSANPILIDNSLIPDFVSETAQVDAIWVNSSDPNTVIIDVVGVNSQLRVLGEIHDIFYLIKLPNGQVKVVASLKSFPSTEAFQIKGGIPYMLFEDREVDPSALMQDQRHVVVGE